MHLFSYEVSQERDIQAFKGQKDWNEDKNHRACAFDNLFDLVLSHLSIPFIDK